MSDWGYIENLKIFKIDGVLRSWWAFSVDVSPEIEYIV